MCFFIYMLFILVKSEIIMLRGMRAGIIVVAMIVAFGLAITGAN